jgi:hypothetical protein
VSQKIKKAHDLVIVHDCLQPVCNGDHSNIRPELVPQRRLNDSVGIVINRRGSCTVPLKSACLDTDAPSNRKRTFIEDEKLTTPNNCPGKS